MFVSDKKRAPKEIIFRQGSNSHRIDCFMPHYTYVWRSRVKTSEPYAYNCIYMEDMKTTLVMCLMDFTLHHLKQNISKRRSTHVFLLAWKPARWKTVKHSVFLIYFKHCFHLCKVTMSLISQGLSFTLQRGGALRCVARSGWEKQEPAAGWGKIGNPFPTQKQTNWKYNG